MARKYPTQSTVKKLFALSGNQCAFPECKDRFVDKSRTLTREICHIEAASDNGPRFNDKSGDEKRIIRPYK